MDYSLTPEEIQAVEKYQDNDFKIMNTLLRSGIESEFRINSRNGKDYPYMTRDMMEKSLNDIANLYSAIIKQYLSNGSKKPEKPLYRGTKISLVDSMQNSNSSFLSTSTIAHLSGSIACFIISLSIKSTLGGIIGEIILIVFEIISLIIAIFLLCKLKYS